MSLYRNIFKKAFELSWKNKYLWFFGVFAALLGNNGGSEIILRSSSGDTGSNFVDWFYKYKETGVFSWHTVVNFFNLLKTDFSATISFVFLSLFTLVLIGFFIWLAIVSQSAIVDGAATYFSKNKNKKNIKDGIEIGNKKFWPVLTLNIIAKVTTLLVLVIVSQLLILSVVFTSSKLAILISIALFVFFFLFSIFFGLVMKYAIAFVVIKNKKVIESIQEGWHLFVNNWLVSIEMAISLFFITLFAGILIILAISILAIPFVFLAIIFLQLFSFFGLWLIIILGFFTFLFFIIFSGAFLTVFVTSSWTGLFMELINNKGVSKIMRLAEKFQK